MKILRWQSKVLPAAVRDEKSIRANAIRDGNVLNNIILSDCAWRLKWHPHNENYKREAVVEPIVFQVLIQLQNIVVSRVERKD